MGLCQVLGSLEGLKRGSSATTLAGMGSLPVILLKPVIDIGLKLVEGRIDFLAKSDGIKLLTNGLVEALGDAIGLRAARFGLGMVDVFEG